MLMQTLIRLQAIAMSFAMHQQPAGRELAIVDTAIGHLRNGAGVVPLYLESGLPP